MPCRNVYFGLSKRLSSETPEVITDKFIEAQMKRAAIRISARSQYFPMPLEALEGANLTT
jgi:hypothetical protein